VKGYARMTSPVGGTSARPHGWLGNAPVGTLFGIEWRRVVDLPFSNTENMMNPLNEGKPVRIARCVWHCFPAAILCPNYTDSAAALNPHAQVLMLRALLYLCQHVLLWNTGTVRSCHQHWDATW
jgi:YT521-B-like domain